MAYLGVVGELASRFDSAGACVSEAVISAIVSVTSRHLYGQVTFSEHHEKCIESICKHAPLPTVRATAVNTLGRIGRMSLHANPAEKAWALTVRSTFMAVGWLGNVWLSWDGVCTCRQLQVFYVSRWQGIPPCG